MAKYFIIPVIALLLYLSATNENYNTEQVCFNDDGQVVFYSSGYNPSSPPVVHITGKIYKNIATNETVYGVCRGSWGACKPKGIDYWRIKPHLGKQDASNN